LSEVITLGTSMGRAIAHDDGKRIHISIGYHPKTTKIDQTVALLPVEMDRLVRWWKDRKKARAR